MSSLTYVLLLLTAAAAFPKQQHDSFGSQHPSHKYVITADRLQGIRSEFMYWYFDEGGPDNRGDLLTEIDSSTSQIQKDLDIRLPFFGFSFNYTRISLNGYLEFSDRPEKYTYPIFFPLKGWPEEHDPSFIGIFYSECKIGEIHPDDVDQRTPGVYFRFEKDLIGRTDQFGVELRERVKWDIREGIIGADKFAPNHAAIITWKNVTFAGGIPSAMYKTNTFQIILATDEVETYAIFNYKDLQWTTHTEAGGDVSGGEGGAPAFVGFNAGNGTNAFQYYPYSQTSMIRGLLHEGYANGFRGRHIFRIDEKITQGTCTNYTGAGLKLAFAPESGNMLGGTAVNITGPCFQPNQVIKCRFDTEEVNAVAVDKNRAICVQPFLQAEGYIRFQVTVDDDDSIWRGKYFVETPGSATEKIIITEDVHELYPESITISWKIDDLPSDQNQILSISLWGYKETPLGPQLLYIDDLETSVVNSGTFSIIPAWYQMRNNDPELQELQYGFIHMNTTGGMIGTRPELWSRPIPLSWYFAPQWERATGSNWTVEFCEKWVQHDRELTDFASELVECPCILSHALLDKGRFMPDPNCDMDGNPSCQYNRGAQHCVRTGLPSLEGSEQQCCYDKLGVLMLSQDQQWGSRPRRSHDFGTAPWNEANKVPTLSQWYNDMIPFYVCCLWQEEQAVGCETLRYERRPTQDCVAYEAPYVATVFGDPHIVTFDKAEYTLSDEGEFVLVQADHNKLSVQGRFQKVQDIVNSEDNATRVTAVATRENSSAVIEVRLRQKEAQWRYKLDVIADGRKCYFDKPTQKVQHFTGVTVYTPANILNQSRVIIMYPSGAGVEVIENNGFMTVQVYLPRSFINKTEGLFGNWNFNETDDFFLPDGTEAEVSTDENGLTRIDKDFAKYWMLENREKSNTNRALFTEKRDHFFSSRKQTSDYQATKKGNRRPEPQKIDELCGTSYQCEFDYLMTQNKDIALTTRQQYYDHINTREMNEKKIISCGVLETPRFGRKSNFLFFPGTKVTFECMTNLTLLGDSTRTCLEDGHWDTPEQGFTKCCCEGDCWCGEECKCTS